MDFKDAPKPVVIQGVGVVVNHPMMLGLGLLTGVKPSTFPVNTVSKGR